MKLVPFLTALAGGVFLSTAALAADAPGAAELAAKLSDLQQDGNTFIRVKMIVSSPANPSDPKTTLQLQIKSRRTSAGQTDVLYQVLFPKERKGEAVLISSNGSGATFTPPDKVQPFDASKFKESLLGGDLSYDDVSDNFFAWKDQSLAGTETVGNVSCQILESKPKGARSTYTMVKSWIDTKRMVPLRVEKYSGNQLVRRIDTSDVANVDGRNVLAMLVIRRAGQPTATEMDGSRIKRGVSYTDADFSAEGLKNLNGPKGGE
ncbi:outer membrane lipoprotein-sorting protein [Verrucomicrobium sp. BvORR106]|uniref:outer membrane lipoprotein-sorting protein n=1 Tax=Verrucomicrobium sp. BvORR106 TaxID=1403819 RepID=UPI00056FD63D|nr:outer membrane lipoprotein-sorting protein [Verrucomicrobium sp. BvORR106]